MKYKYFEIRDRITMILIRADEIIGNAPTETEILKYAGWDQDYPSITFTFLDGGMKTYNNPYEYCENERVRKALIYIERNYQEFTDELSVIDIEYILNEKDNPCKSEILSK